MSLFVNVGFATSLAFYRSPKGLSLENSEKNLKRAFSGPLGPGVKKTRKRVENDNFSSFFSGFRLVFNSFSFFLSFFDPGPGIPFQIFFGVLQGEAFLTPVEGQRCRNVGCSAYVAVMCFGFSAFAMSKLVVCLQPVSKLCQISIWG